MNYEENANVNQANYRIVAHQKAGKATIEADAKGGKGESSSSNNKYFKIINNAIKNAPIMDEHVQDLYQ